MRIKIIITIDWFDVCLRIKSFIIPVIVSHIFYLIVTNVHQWIWKQCVHFSTTNEAWFQEKMPAQNRRCLDTMSPHSHFTQTTVNCYNQGGLLTYRMFNRVENFAIEESQIVSHCSTLQRNEKCIENFSTDECFNKESQLLLPWTIVVANTNSK